MCANVKIVINTSIGNDLVLDNYVNTAISKVLLFKRAPKNSLGSLGRNL